MSEDLLYLFTGDAEIFIDNRINRIISSYDKYQVEVQKYDLESSPISSIIEDLNTIPFLSDYKIIIIKNPVQLKNATIDSSFDALIKYFKKPINTTVLIIDAVNIEINPENPLYKALMNYAAIIDYSNSQEIEIKGWIKRTCSNHNAEITDEAVDLFLEYIGDDQIRMINELDKLIDYIGPFGLIEAADIKLLITKDLSNEIFSLIKAINMHDKDKIHEIYTILSSQTKDISGLIALIASSLKDLLTVAKLKKKGYAQTDIAKILHISSGRAYYLIQDSENFKMKELKDYVIKFANLDYQTKSGQLDKNSGLNLILMNI